MEYARVRLLVSWFSEQIGRHLDQGAVICEWSNILFISHLSVLLGRTSQVIVAPFQPSSEDVCYP